MRTRRAKQSLKSCGNRRDCKASLLYILHLQRQVKVCSRYAKDKWYYRYAKDLIHTLLLIGIRALFRNSYCATRQRYLKFSIETRLSNASIFVLSVEPSQLTMPYVSQALSHTHTHIYHSISVSVYNMQFISQLRNKPPAGDIMKSFSLHSRFNLRLSVKSWLMTPCGFGLIDPVPASRSCRLSL